MEPFTARADVCAEKLREWRQAGSNVSVLDLRKAYLQIRVHRSLWPYQTVLVKGKRYCLTRMGFGLSVAPSIMQMIVDAVLTQDERTRHATSTYIDDVYVDEGVAFAARVKEHLLNIGLLSKEPERLQDGACVLGLQVREEDGVQHWKRGNEAPHLPHDVTLLNIFSWCGNLIGHLPVGGWLRVAVAFIKRRASEVTTGWDDEVHDAPLNTMLGEVATRVHKEDPAQG